MENENKPTQIAVKQKNKALQKVKVRFEISAREIKLQLVEALRNLPKADFRKIIRATRQLRLADAIANDRKRR